MCTEGISISNWLEDIFFVNAPSVNEGVSSNSDFIQVWKAFIEKSKNPYRLP